MPNPAAAAYTGAKILTGQKPEPLPFGYDPLNDSARRASMINQGLIREDGSIPGSNVPAAQIAGRPNIPTRAAVGLGGDAAFADTANAFRSQIARQLGVEVAGINRAFGGAGRFTSGQRLGAIERAQTRAGGAFNQFLSSTALERFLQQQRLQVQADIARMQIEAGQGSGRTQLFGEGVRGVSQIVASNFDFFKNLFKRDTDFSGFSGGLPEQEDLSKLFVD